MTPDTAQELIILSNLKARRSAAGRLIMTQKFLDGVAEYARNWPGTVTTLVGLDTRPGIDMDQVETDLTNDSVRMELRPETPEGMANRLEKAALVVMLLSPYETEAAALCHRLGVPVVFVSEYTPRTERDIMNLTTPDVLRRLRRRWYIRQSETKRLKMLRKFAAGLQCSGTPTYDLYSPIVPNTLLFFDNRVPADVIMTQEALAEKTAKMVETAPLRLVFGGRLTAMKGVMDLPRVALALNRRNVPYHLDICGSGDQEDLLRRQIDREGLSDRITLLPPMDFRTGWVPYLQRNADLFVCCHPQGDPSSTYSEVMSCGVPIVGYDNEAFAGIVRESGAGWSVPIGDAEAMAAEIARLHEDRSDLQKTARSGLEFARKHRFEATFCRRSAHLRAASRLPENLKAAFHEQEMPIS